MDRSVLLLIVLGAAVAVLAARWMIRAQAARVAALERRVRELESGQGRTTAAVLADARAGSGSVVGGPAMGGGFASRLALLAGRSAPFPDADAVFIEDAVHRGASIEAIKRVREVTGLGLKEAKDVVDRVRAEFGR